VHSAKVPYYILDLLQHVASVYVRGLGRFDAIFHPAVVDLQQSRIKPPHIEPAFAPGDFDDREILPMYMHYVSGMHRSEAEDYINDFVAFVRSQIEENGTCSIEKFGSFTKSANDVIHFTPDWDAFNLTFTGLETLDLRQANIYEPVISTPVIEEQPIENTEHPNYTYDAPAETNWVTDRETPLPEIPVTETPPPAQHVISDSTSRLWWIILATALFLITILCAYLAWDIFSNRERVNQIVAITNDSLANASPDIIIVDTIDVVEEELPSDTPVVTEPVEELPEPEPEKIEKPCYIVVGAFSKNENVINMENRLQGLGYTTEQIKGGNLTRVAIQSACDRQTLQSKLNEVRASINPEAWIY
jgi:hypothetical protein